MKRKHLGKNFEDFLEEEGILEECRAAAIKFKIAHELEKAVRRRIGRRAATAGVDATVAFNETIDSRCSEHLKRG